MSQEEDKEAASEQTVLPAEAPNGLFRAQLIW